MNFLYNYLCMHIEKLYTHAVRAFRCWRGEAKSTVRRMWCTGEQIIIISPPSIHNKYTAITFLEHKCIKYVCLKWMIFFVCFFSNMWMKAVVYFCTLMHFTNIFNACILRFFYDNRLHIIKLRWIQIYRVRFHIVKIYKIFKVNSIWLTIGLIANRFFFICI